MPVITCKAYPDLRMTIAPLEIIHAMIKEAYFATATIDEVQIPGNTTTPTQEYIVVSGDTLGGIATKYQTSVAAIIHHDPNITSANQHQIKVGQKIQIPGGGNQAGTGKKISFTKIDTITLGSEFYIIVETENFQGHPLAVTLRQGKENGLEDKDANILLQDDQGNYAEILRTTVGGTCETKYVNRDDFVEKAIFRCSIATHDQAQQERWNKALEKATDQKTYAYLVVDAHTDNPSKRSYIKYQGNRSDMVYKGVTMQNVFLDEAGSWLELESGLCKDTWDTASNTRIEKLHPILQCSTRNFINEVQAKLNIKLRVVSGYRSFAEQTVLYNQGRTTAGNKVTNAKAGESYHNYGLAIDVCEIKNGKAIWDVAMYKKIAPYAKNEGFAWGGDWKSFQDNPHFDMAQGKSTLELKNLYYMNNQDYTKIKL